MYDGATLQLPNRGEMVVVGTNHLNADSVRQVREVIAARSPKGVLLELCGDRAPTVLGYADGLPPPLPPMSWALARRNWRQFVDPLFWLKLPFLGAEALVGSTEGYEFTAAAVAAKGVGAQVFLIDRPVGATLTRMVVGLGELSWAERRSILFSGLSSEGSAADVREVMRIVQPWPWRFWRQERLGAEQLGRARVLTRRVIETLDPNQEILEIPPAIRRPLLDERDVVMAHNIYHVARQLPPGSCAVAVVGAAHVRGIERLFGEHAAAAQSGSPGGCSPEQMLALQERADVQPLLRLVCGTLIGASVCSFGARIAFMRWLKRTRDGELAHWCRRINIGSVVMGTASLAATGATFTAAYDCVRDLQLSCAALNEGS